MSVTVETAAPDRLLATKDDVERELGGSVSLDSTEAEFLILAASAAIETHLGTILALQEYTETIIGEGGCYLYVSYSPIIPVSSTVDLTVSYYGAELSDAEISDADIGEIYVESGVNWTAPIGSGISNQQMAGRERPLYSVNYRGGYWLPNWSAEAVDETGKIDLPASIRRAVAMLAAMMYTQAHSGGTPQLLSKTVGDLKYTYADQTQALKDGKLPDEVLCLLPKPRIL